MFRQWHFGVALCVVPVVGVASQTPSPEGLVTATARIVAPLADTGDARAAGYRPLQIGRMLDRTPFQGEHWVDGGAPAALLAGPPDLARPTFLMYARVEGRLQRVGAAYSMPVAAGAKAPDSLGGVAAQWHTHQPCLGIPGEGITLADNTEECTARGGRPTPMQVTMVHVWTDAESPIGPFSHDNPALPYFAVGLLPPTREELADPRRGPAARLLGLAIGETYGALLPYARRIELQGRDAARADSLESARVRLTGLVSELLRAEREGNDGVRTAAIGTMLRIWDHMARLYQAMAPNAGLRDQFVRQVEEARLGLHDAAAAGSAGHHH